MPWEISDNFVRSGHTNPNKFAKESMRTITIDKGKGILAVVGCPRGGWKNGRCATGTEVQSYLFSRKKGWNASKAKSWFAEHKSKDKKKEEVIIVKEEMFTKALKEITDVWYKRPGQRDNK